MAGHDRPVAGRGRLAAAEGVRPPPVLVGGRTQTGATTCGRAQHQFAVCRRTADGAGVDHESDGRRQCDAAGYLSDSIPPEFEGHHLHRPEIALRLHGLVADLALRQQRARTLQRQGRALGAQLLYRPPAVDRGRLSRRQYRFEITDAAVSAAAALFRRGKGFADQIRYQRIRAKDTIPTNSRQRRATRCSPRRASRKAATGSGPMTKASPSTWTSSALAPRGRRWARSWSRC